MGRPPKKPRVSQEATAEAIKNVNEPDRVEGVAAAVEEGIALAGNTETPNVGDNVKAIDHGGSQVRSCTLDGLTAMGVLFPLTFCRTMVIGNCYRCRKVGCMGHVWATL